MLISDQAAPSLAQLRPLKQLRTDTFPVYQHLADKLRSGTRHPDDTVAHVLAVAAGYAYARADTVATMMARMGLEDNGCRMIQELVDAMFICSTSFLVQSADGKVVLLAYRGTEPSNLVNWLTDADLYPEKVVIPATPASQPLEVHEGFYRNVRATRYEVVAALERALRGEPVGDFATQPPGAMEALYITGHSLGGAMAALMAVMLVTDPAYETLGEKLRAVYTFGQPMIGSHGLARVAGELLAGRAFRYVYCNDAVPHLPPRVSGDFAHFGAEYRFAGRRPWVAQVPPAAQMGGVAGVVGTMAEFAATKVQAFRSIPFRFSLDDHMPNRYITALTPPGTPTEFGDDGSFAGGG